MKLIKSLFAMSAVALAAAPSALADDPDETLDRYTS